MTSSERKEARIMDDALEREGIVAFDAAWREVADRLRTQLSNISSQER